MKENSRHEISTRLHCGRLDALVGVFAVGGFLPPGVDIPQSARTPVELFVVDSHFASLKESVTGQLWYLGAPFRTRDEKGEGDTLPDHGSEKRSL